MAVSQCPVIWIHEHVRTVCYAPVHTYLGLRTSTPYSKTLGVCTCVHMRAHASHSFGLRTLACVMHCIPSQAMLPRV